MTEPRTRERSDEIQVGVFKFPTDITFVLHREEPLASVGYLNGRVCHADSRLDDPVVRLCVPLTEPGPLETPFLTLWVGERWWMTCCHLRTNVTLDAGDVLEFRAGWIDIGPRCPEVCRG